jgi:hypothetical protein
MMYALTCIAGGQTVCRSDHTGLVSDCQFGTEDDYAYDESCYLTRNQSFALEHGCTSASHETYAVNSLPSAFASNPVPNSQSLICAFAPILTFEHRIVFSIFALHCQHQEDRKRRRTHFSSMTTKSHSTQPVNLAPFPITQCRPMTHFLILVFSATLVLSPIALSGLI